METPYFYPLKNKQPNPQTMNQKIGTILLILWGGIILNTLWEFYDKKTHLPKQIKQITEWRCDPETNEKLYVEHITSFDSLGQILEEISFAPNSEYARIGRTLRKYFYSSSSLDDNGYSVFILEVDMMQGGFLKRIVNQEFYNDKLMEENRRYEDTIYNQQIIFKYDSLGRKIEEISDGYEENIIGNYRMFFSYDPNGKMSSIYKLDEFGNKKQVLKISHPEKYHEIEESIVSDYRAERYYSTNYQLIQEREVRDGKLYRENIYDYKNGLKVFSTQKRRTTSCYRLLEQIIVEKSIYEYEFY